MPKFIKVPDDKTKKQKDLSINPNFIISIQRSERTSNWKVTLTNNQTFDVPTVELKEFFSDLED